MPVHVVSDATVEHRDVCLFIYQFDFIAWMDGWTRIIAMIDGLPASDIMTSNRSVRLDRVLLDKSTPTISRVRPCPL